ncbi:MAG: hypothetical protein HKN34_05310 [Gammaproteobacteria bacterium]|nr:hypothetical protein [Gammaproteobacteria bacterium]
MNRAITFLQGASKGKIVLILFILTNIVYGTILGYSIPLVLSFAPDATLFDMSPAGYSYSEAIELLKSLGLEGRNTYLTVQIPLDFVYPAMFAISYALLITWILKQSFARESSLFFLAFLPLLAGFFDYLENISIIAMLSRFPHVSENLVLIASSFTIAKSVMTSLYFVFLLVALTVLVARFLKKFPLITGNKG